MIIRPQTLYHTRTEILRKSVNNFTVLTPSTFVSQVCPCSSTTRPKKPAPQKPPPRTWKRSPALQYEGPKYARGEKKIIRT